jgi:hypothetical protein
MCHETATWAPVTGYEGAYDVSTCGEVRNHRTGRILKQCEDKDGYMRVGLWRNAERSHGKVHQMVARVFDDPSRGPVVRHLDGNSKNNHSGNLRFGSVAENVRDAIAHGTYKSPLSEPRTHCPKGHPYNDENTVIWAGGDKRCRLCRRARTEACTAARRLAAAKK